jgi:hypothetical protein
MLTIFKKVFLKRDTYYSLIIGILIVIILFMRSCSPSPCPPTDGGKPIVVTKIDTVWKDKIIAKNIYVPGPVKIIPGSPFYKDIDTLAILKDFFAKKIYEDSIKIDTFGYVFVRDTISENKIISRQTEGKYKIPIITKTTTTTIPYRPRNQVFIGFDVMGSKKEPINYFGPSLMFKNKVDKVYEIGLGFNPYSSQVVGKIGLKWKIKIK